MTFDEWYLMRFDKLPDMEDPVCVDLDTSYRQGYSQGYWIARTHGLGEEEGP